MTLYSLYSPEEFVFLKFRSEGLSTSSIREKSGLSRSNHFSSVRIKQKSVTVNKASCRFSSILLLFDVHFLQPLFRCSCGVCENIPCCLHFIRTGFLQLIYSTRV